MLVLSRNLDERIFIGDSVIVTVVEIKGLTVRLGVDAPREITIDREEVRDAKLRNPRPYPPPAIARPHPVPPRPPTTNHGPDSQPDGSPAP